MNDSDITIDQPHTPEEKARWAAIKGTQFGWARKKSKELKHTPGLKNFFETIVRCSNSKGICSVGIEALLKNHNKHNPPLSQRSAERYVATLKAQKLIWKYELKTRWNKSQSTPKRFYKTWATRLTFEPTAKLADIINHEVRFISGEVVSSLTTASPSTSNQKNETNSKEASAPPLGFAPGVLASAELDGEPRPFLHETIEQRRERIKRHRSGLASITQKWGTRKNEKS